MVGTGLVGPAWATVFARGGWQVRLFDSAAGQSASAIDLIATSLAEQESAGLVRDATEAATCVSIAASLEAAVDGAQWVQESLPENVAVKRDAFTAIDTAAPPEAIIASSSSGIPASAFTADLPGRARCLVAHPVNPPHLIPVVELCGSPWTSAGIVERARTLMTELKQVPVVVRREIDGFILNRLQGALLNEAMRLVGEGYVSAADVDKTIAHGLGLRWSFMGPFATIELNAPGGVADYVRATAASTASSPRIHLRPRCGTRQTLPASPRAWASPRARRAGAQDDLARSAVARARQAQVGLVRRRLESLSWRSVLWKGHRRSSY